MPPLTQKNIALAARMTGLPQPGPVKMEELQQQFTVIARLAGLLDRLDQELPPDLLARMQSETPQRPS